MLVWKIQTLNINVASLRYRCLFPLRYLANRGVVSEIYGSKDTVKLTPQTKAIVFVKSFHHVDVATCDRAHKQNIPIVLDLCDNIFIEGYGADSNYVPAQNFRVMAQQAAAIVTTGSAMKAEVDALISTWESDHKPIVVIIPDGSESIEDIRFAFRSTRLKRQRLIAEKLLRQARQFYAQSVQAIAKKIPFAHLLNFGERASAQKASAQKASAQKANKKKTNKKKANKKKSSPKKKSPKNQNEPAPLWPKPWPNAPGVKTVLWFGNHGAKYGNFGMLNLLEVADALKKVSEDCPLRLMVISNHRKKYETQIAPLPFATHYLPWHPRKIYDYIRASDVVIVPNSQSRYSICKSANRAVLSLSQGTPVVASRTPALDLLNGCVYLDDWEAGLRTYLLNPAIADAHVQKAQQVIEQNLSGEAIAQKWSDLLNQITQNSATNSQTTPSSSTYAIKSTSA